MAVIAIQMSIIIGGLLELQDGTIKINIVRSVYNLLCAIGYVYALPECIGTQQNGVVTRSTITVFVSTQY